MMLRAWTASMLLVACSSNTASDGGAPTGANRASSAPAASSAPSPTSSASPVSPSASSAAEHGVDVKTADYEGVIMPSSLARVFGDPVVGGAKVDGTWTPTPADVAAFEAGLEAYLQANAPKHARDLAKKYHPYKRQWAGVTAGGARKIFANFFCSTENDWHERWILVKDGGDCYFQISFDVASKTYSDLSVNGEG